ncbi:MAG: hypothetical protein KAH10_08610 [Flavobacteriales bacterium]|nr:hypothetical protein [Flavobacteriales bacterium]
MKIKFWTASIALIGAMLLTASCEKSKDTIDASSDPAEISFSFTLPGQTFGKNSDVSPKDGSTPECRDEEADYVTLLLEGTNPIVAPKWYTLDLLGLGDGTITEAIKIPAGDYTVTDFYVFSDEDGDMDGFYPADAPQATYPAPDGMDYDDDVVLYASPYEGSYYDNLFNFTFNVSQDFELLPFEKEKNNIDVLCYTPAEYEEFGFKHWDYHPFEVREKCFFGDICTKFWDDFGEYRSKDNPYYGWPEHYDMYGIFEVVVQNPDRVDEAGNLIQGAVTTSTNLGWDFNDVDAMGPVCVEYLDDLEVDGEVYPFELWIYWPDGTKTMEYAGEFTDAKPNPFGWITDDTGAIIGGDGVFTWQVGDCTHPSADIELILPAVLYLPSEGVIKVTEANFGGLHPYDYFDVTLLGPTWNNVLYPDELFEGNILGGWCGDLYTAIEVPGTYNTFVYSSLKPWEMPNVQPNGQPEDLAIHPSMQNYPWEALNWLANEDALIAETVTEGKEVQALIWILIHSDDVTVVDKINQALGANFVQDHGTIAQANAVLAASAGYTPRTGDWSVVALRPYTQDLKPEWVQLVLVRVDP